MRKAIAAEYEALRPVVEAARKEAGISEFLDPDDTEAESVIKAAREKLALPAAPAMPTLRVYDERLTDPPHSPFCPLPSVCRSLTQRRSQQRQWRP